MAGGAIRSVPVEANDAFFGALERAMMHSIPKPIAVVTCYPSNPTACVADLDFYRELIAFAKKHRLLVLSDLAYAEVYFDDNPPPSVLQVPGAMDVAVEFTSMSKTYSMPGWRIGFAVGNERIIAALARVKSYLDYGAFTPIQVAATAALNGPDDCIHEMRAIYRRRRDALVEFVRPRRLAGAAAAGLDVRLGADSRAVPAARQRGILHAPGREGGRRGVARGRLRRTRRRPCAHRAWSRTSSASARPPATSGAFLKPGRKCCTTSFPWRRGVSRAHALSSQVSDVYGRAVESRSCRTGDCRHGRRPALGAWPRQAHGALRPADRGRCRQRASRGKKRAVDLKKFRWVADPVALACDPAIDVLVELIGGEGDPAKRAVETALAAGKPVVTANKALLAGHGHKLAVLAERHGVALNFEASVAGGIPIVKTLREGLNGDSLMRVYGILNGTCNYILSRMEQDRLAFDECLREAQRLGYAEADPSFDVEGHDTAQKLAILASLAFGTKVDPDAVYIEGISSITLADLDAAGELGYRVKLLGVAVRTEAGIEQRVHPTMVPKESAIAQVMGVTNAVTVDADGLGADHAGRSRRRRYGDRFGGRIRSRRHCARGPHAAVRTSGRAHDG